MQGMAIVNAEEKITYCRCPENILLLLLKKGFKMFLLLFNALCRVFIVK